MVFLSLIFHEYESFEREFFPSDPDAGHLEVLFSLKKSPGLTSETISDEELQFAHHAHTLHHVIDSIHSISIASVSHTSDLLDTDTSDLVVTIFSLADRTSFWIILSLEIKEARDIFSSQIRSNRIWILDDPIFIFHEDEFFYSRIWDPLEEEIFEFIDTDIGAR